MILLSVLVVFGRPAFAESCSIPLERGSCQGVPLVAELVYPLQSGTFVQYSPVDIELQSSLVDLVDRFIAQWTVFEEGLNSERLAWDMQSPIVPDLRIWNKWSGKIFWLVRQWARLSVESGLHIPY